jgi:hypothetical protein
VISELHIEFFSKIPGVGPEERWISVFFPIALANILGRWKNPRDHRDLFGPLTFPKSQLEDFLGSEVIFSDDLLVLSEERIVSRSESDERSLPVTSSIHFATIGRTLLGELDNSFLYKFLWLFGERGLFHHVAPFQQG